MTTRIIVFKIVYSVILTIFKYFFLSDGGVFPPSVIAVVLNV